MPSLPDLLARRHRTVAGLMSGTSLDGVDAVVVDLDGSGRGMAMEVRGRASLPYDAALRETLLQNSLIGSSDVRDLSGLAFRLAAVYADAVRAAAADAGLDPETLDGLDAVGIHGQTVHHVPDGADVAGVHTASTLQIGNPSALAALLGVTVVGDFRAADVALGGQGAPLVPYLDYVRFAADDETRLLVNLGGIANATILPAGQGADAVVAFDTGPANMISDRLARVFFGQDYDDGGRIAASGTSDVTLLAWLMEDPYLDRLPPKSTGRELYDERFVAAFVERAGLAYAPVTSDADAARARDLVATAVAFSAEALADATRRFLTPIAPPDVVVLSGGGRHNAALVAAIAARFAPTPVRTTDDYGVDGDLKEALLVAVLAHETLNGVPANLPRVTGAARPVVLGVIAPAG